MSIRRFKLLRREDVTGVSGTGIVAEGVEFSDGSCVVRWLSNHPTTVTHDSIESVEAIHGHGGATEIKWVDAAASRVVGRPEGSSEPEGG